MGLWVEGKNRSELKIAWIFIIFGLGACLGAGLILFVQLTDIILMHESIRTCLLDCHPEGL